MLNQLVIFSRYGKACSLVCTSGFLIGTSRITCQASGQWTVITAQCAARVPGSNSPPLGILLSSSSVSENSPHNTEVGGLTTVDPDEDQSFTYSLVNVSHVFDVDDGAGMLIVVGDLDYERQSVYSVTLMSTDNGFPPMSVTQNLTVRVTDVNEAPSKLDIVSPYLQVFAFRSTIDKLLLIVLVQIGFFRCHGPTSTKPTPLKIINNCGEFRRPNRTEDRNSLQLSSCVSSIRKYM